MDVFQLALFLGEVLDFGGVLVIVIGVVYTTILFLYQWFQHKAGNLYKEYRHGMGKAILLGLDFLVAGDIIRSVVGDPTYATIGILAIIILIRITLSITLEMEMDGRWPWQRKS